MANMEAMTEKAVDPKRIGRTFGILFLLTWVTAIGGRFRRSNTRHRRT